MKKLILVLLFMVLFIGGSIWALFTFIIPSVGFPELKIPIGYEEKLGDIIVEDIFLKNPSFAEIKNPGLDSTLGIIINKLTQNLVHSDYNYHFRVVQNPEVNAFTLPGGNIFVFTGLIEFSEHPEEVAAVLAHEIGHAEKRHVVSKLVKEMGLTFIIGMFTGGDPTVITQIGSTILSTVFDREQERDADVFGLELLTRSKISPQWMAVFFKRLEEEKGTYNKSLEILMTHPNTDSRINAALEYKIPEGFKSEEFGLDWRAVKESLAEKRIK